MGPYYIRKGLVLGLCLDILDCLYRKKFLPEQKAIFHLGLTLNEEIVLWAFLISMTVSSCVLIQKCILVMS